MVSNRKIITTITLLNSLNSIKILDLVEKNYENLVEVLTNNTMTPSSSDPKLYLRSQGHQIGIIHTGG